MVSKHRKYTLVLVVWCLLTMGGPIVVASGATEPFLPASRLPGGEAGAVGAGLGAAVVGWVVISQLQRRLWRGAGRAAGLSPESGLLGRLVGYPDLSGTVRGRPVRVRTVGGGGEDSRSTRTLIEARLSAPAETGVVVGRTESGDPAAAATTFGLPVETHTVDGEFWAVGDAALAEEVLTGAVRDALRAAGEVDGVYAGDVSAALDEEAPGGGNSIGDTLTSLTTSSLAPGDGTTVTWKRKGVVVDPEEVDRIADVVAAVADAVEAATGGPTAETGTGRRAR